MSYYEYEYGSTCHRSRRNGYRAPGVLLGAGRLIAKWAEETFPKIRMYIPMVDRSTAAMATAVSMYTDLVEPVIWPSKKHTHRHTTRPTTPIC